MILIVDDEPFVRELTRRILERHGYNAQTCSNGAEAMKTLEAHAEEIDLVLLDIFMPALSGDTLLKALRTARPDVAVVASTGFDSQDIMRRFGSKGVVACIHKPFDAQELVAQVRSVLKKKARHSWNAAA
jgi:CheY-like chemotaxis protein